MKYIIILIILSGGLLMSAGCASDNGPAVPGPLYKTEEGKELSYKSYDQVMGFWNTDFREDWVETDYGLTHIVTAGPDKGSPVFLLPGLFADASMWYANAGAISTEYRVLAVDLPVYGGKSVPSGKKITDIHSYREWFEEILAYYGYKKAALAGLSYGSWLSLALSREIPETVAAVIMLDPSETFTKMRGSMMWKGFKYFMLFPNRSKYEKFFNWIGGGFSSPESDIWLQHMLDVIEYGTTGMMDVPQHRIYAPEELEMVTMPVLILIGGKPIIYKDPGHFIEEASRALPHAEIDIIEDTGHSLNVEKPEEVNSRILDFLNSNYIWAPLKT